MLLLAPARLPISVVCSLSKLHALPDLSKPLKVASLSSIPIFFDAPSRSSGRRESFDVLSSNADTSTGTPFPGKPLWTWEALSDELELDEGLKGVPVEFVMEKTREIVRRDIFFILTCLH